MCTSKCNPTLINPFHSCRCTFPLSSFSYIIYWLACMCVCLVWLDMCLSIYISIFMESLGILNVWANSYKSMRQRRWVSGSRGGGVVLSEPLKNRHSGQSTGINILSVSGSVQGRFWGTAVYLREGMLEKLNGGQDLWKEWPLILGLLDAVSHQPFHGFGAVLIELAEVWR